MIRCYSIVLSIYLFCSSIYASNDWSHFEARNIYPAVDKSNCVFPFTYKNQVYNDCTTDGDNGNLPWCSLTSTYQGMGTYCYDFWNSSLQCLPKFTINGKTYNKCDFLSRTATYKQCKTNNTAVPYRYCIEQHLKKSAVGLNRLNSCDPTYKSLSSLHTMCFGPSDHAIQVPITPTDQQDLLDMHNAYRANTSARYMFKLYWDDELAKMAQAHSDMCLFDHDLAVNRYSPKYNWKNGQNMIMTSEIRSSLADLVDMMFSSEKLNFVYGTGCAPDPGTCLHYTQGMLSNMTRVGCAHTHCLFPDRIERYLTCNYINSQYADNYMIPYVPSSAPAIDCPSHAVGNLCDCGNKICNYNNGEYLDPATCNCKTAVTKRSIGKRAANDIDSMKSNRRQFATVPHGKKIDSHALKKVST
ncbi:unnamed protein product [Rotaria magnacalcarata]|uniref:Fibronectin type-II domain-containing protein n=1 Tax=Rotaria magnacalcarata TaxID=392030 RepID=A0A816S9W8_9BILA|nr:unnamed protein product [Rotaria magnacalcarata]CAF2139890.1 unnamed protein product [Rotaria magnacalcarata]CAF3733500.1 unnamed protein product [Rotaria magnacalcarata]CAF3974939.1 unnamed protein product [Rotaria magnacalcarata]